VFRLSRPTTSELTAFLARQATATLSHSAPGATKDETPPKHYNYDRRRITLGRGAATFERAKRALRDWRHFDLGWVDVKQPALPVLRPGTDIAVVVRVLGLYAVNATRIEYLIEEPRRFGFAYGTLQEHFESGEERFLITWDEDDTVSYDLSAFSRPHHPLVWLGYPYARTQQRRFMRGSLAAMSRAMR
jgi:uncharacterized protein (UPF0548 family)